MSKEKARAHYIGKDGCQRMNCGQAVIAAFRERFSLGETEIAAFSAYGGGKAPEGKCGALYAAVFIMKKARHDAITGIEERFASSAGSTKCREIRALKKLSCVGCVEKAAELVDAVRAHP